MCLGYLGSLFGKDGYGFFFFFFLHKENEGKLQIPVHSYLNKNYFYDAFIF